MISQTFIRRAVPVAAALAVGAGAGAAIYAGTSGGGSSAGGGTTVVASVPAQPAATTSTSLPQLYKNVAPGVVDIKVDTTSGGFGDQQAQAEGSGFVIDTDGHVVTNAHVVDGATSITVRFQNGKTAKATLVGTDASSDIAVIKVDADASQLHPLSWGSSSALQVGQDVAAIGSPFGLPETLTSGIVSALNRTITAPNNYSISGAIQTDAPINHGNSGGPLLNSKGQVVGVNAQIESDSGGNDGVGFSLPSDSVKQVVSTLIAGGKVQHAYIGVSIADSSSGAGAQIASVKADSPASKAGLQAGDVVTAMDGDSIGSADDLTAKISAHAPGDKVTLTVNRNGKTQTIDVTLGTRPS